MIDIDGNRDGWTLRGSGFRPGSCGVFGWRDESHEKFLGEAANLGAEDGLGAVVPEHHIRKGHFLGNGELGGENRLNQGGVKSAAGLEPLDLRGAGGSDDEHAVLAEIKSLFK